jgi:hypothetical protein
VRLVSVAVLTVSIALSSSLARADAVGPPPLSCPRGSEPRSDHGGARCAPTTCASTADCRPAETMATCAPIGLCIETGTGYSRGGPFTFDVVTGACATQADCAGSARCELADRCAGPGGGFWIAVCGGVCAAVVALLGLLIATITLASRRARSSSTR